MFENCISRRIATPEEEILLIYNSITYLQGNSFPSSNQSEGR